MCASAGTPAGGPFASAHWMRLDHPLVPATDEGALRLGELYLDHLRQATATLVRPRRRAGRISLQLAGRVDLISFGDVSASVDRGGVECRFTIAGGVLFARGGGSRTVVQGRAQAAA